MKRAAATTLLLAASLATWGCASSSLVTCGDCCCGVGCGVAVNEVESSPALVSRNQSLPTRAASNLERLFSDTRADGVPARHAEIPLKAKEPSTLKVIDSTADGEVITAAAEELIEPEQRSTNPTPIPNNGPSLPAARPLAVMPTTSGPELKAPNYDDGCCSCGQPVCGPAQCCLLCGGRLCPLTCVRKFCERPAPGPPPVTMQVAMPPKFLPVPTHAIVPPARPDAPEFRRGDVEAHYGPQLWYSSPGRD